jgi:ribosomal protein L29
LEIDDLRDLKDNQLKEELEESQKGLMNLRFRASTMQLNDTNQVNVSRKKISRIKTIIREREIVRMESV